MQCNAFYWIDPELSSQWYKAQLFELYLTLHPEERALYAAQVTIQDQLESLEHEFEVYQNDMDLQIQTLELELMKSKKKATKLFKCLFGLLFLFLLALVF